MSEWLTDIFLCNLESANTHTLIIITKKLSNVIVIHIAIG